MSASPFARLALEPEASAASRGRRWVVQRVRELGLADLEDTVALLTSEVVTNAVLHAGTPAEVSVRTDGAGVRVEVVDGSTTPPLRRLGYSRTSTTGRGCLLLDRLATRWGWAPLSDGKVTWFVVELEPDRPDQVEPTAEELMAAWDE